MAEVTAWSRNWKVSGVRGQHADQRGGSGVIDALRYQPLGLDVILWAYSQDHESGRAMLAEQPNVTDFSVVNRFFDAVERGDLDTVRRCFAPGALAWHNHDEVEIDVDSVVALIGHLCAVSTSRSYTDRRLTTVSSQAFIQQTLNADLRSGRQLQVKAMVRIEIDADGLVERMEEYLDSRAVDVIGGEGGAR